MDGQSNGNKSMTTILTELRDLMEIESRLDTTIAKKRDRAVQKLDKLIVETFKQKIEILSRKDKTMQQRKYAIKPLRILCESTTGYFTDSYGTLKRLLFLIRNNHSLLMDLAMDMGKYMKGMQSHCQHLMDTFTRFFFNDFGSDPRSTHDFHRFVYDIINNSTNGKDPLKEYEKNELVKALIDHVLARDEVINFAKGVFVNAKLEVIEEEHYDSFFSGAAISPTVSHNQELDARKKSVLVSRAFRVEDESSEVLETAVRQAEKIWKNLRSYVELVPITLRYLCKMIVTILRKKCGSGFPEEKEKSILTDIIIHRLIVNALIDLIEYNVVMDCVVSDTHQKVAANVGRVLKALVLGNLFQKGEPIGMYANKFIETSQGEVKEFVKELLGFTLPNYEQDYRSKEGEIVQAQGICMTLLNVQFIFDLIAHNYRHYSRKYPMIGSLMNRLMYHVTNDQIFVAKRELFKNLDESMGIEEFAQAYKYFIFTEVKVKPPAVTTPQLIQEQPESVNMQQIIKIVKDLLLNITMRDYMPGSQTSDTLSEFLATIHDVARKRKEVQTGLMLDTDYLLKLNKDGILTPEFLMQVKVYLTKKNQDTQEKLNFLAIQQKKTYESVNQVISLARKQVEEDGQSVLCRVKAAEYIKYYTKQFMISFTNVNDTRVLTIKFPEEPVEENSSPRIKSKRIQPTFPATIEEFIRGIVMFSEMKELISTGNDKKKIGSVYTEYMSTLHERLLNDDAFFKGLNIDQRERIYQEVESHVAFELYSRAFPKTPSPADNLFQKKMKLLQWIDPVSLGVKKSDLKVDYWKSACEDLQKMEAARTPRQKLDYLMQCVNLITQGLMKFSQRSEPPGADDLTPIFNYILIMTAPRMIYSNLNYITAFRSATMDETAYCYTQIRAAVEYLEKLNAATLGMKQDEFLEKMKQQAAKYCIKFDPATWYSIIQKAVNK